MKSRGWRGCDLDGTLAEYNGWKGETHIGAPIMPMVERVKKWIKEDKLDVRIFTARVTMGEGRHTKDVETITSAIQDWLESVGLPRLPVTNVKDFGMVELWDDRAIAVERNTGHVLGGSFVQHVKLTNKD